MVNVVTNAYIFEDRHGVKRLFAEVVEDERYPTGHHIVTSMVVSVSTDIEGGLSGVVQTESETVYQVNKLLTKEEFIAHVKENFDEETANWYLWYTNLV